MIKTCRLKFLLSEPLKYGASEIGYGYDGTSDQLRYIRITDIASDGRLRENNQVYLSKDVGMQYALRPSDILLARSGATVGKAFMFTGPARSACFAGYLIRARVNTKMAVPKFVYYSLMSDNYWAYVDSYHSKSTIQNLNAELYGSVRVPYPSKEEQIKIVAFLDQAMGYADTLIAKYERLLELLEEKNIALVIQAVTKGLEARVSLKDSGIDWVGNIPNHWKVMPLKRLVSMKSGDQITSEQIQENGDFPVYGGNGLRGYTDSFTHNGAFTLIGRQGALCGNINYANGRFWASEHAVVVKPRSICSILWLGELLRSMNLGQYSVSAAQPGLSVEAIGNLKIPVPPYTEQAEISKLLEEHFRLIGDLCLKATSAINLIQEHRSALITAAVTGQIDVANYKSSKIESVA